MSDTRYGCRRCRDGCSSLCFSTGYQFSLGLLDVGMTDRIRDLRCTHTMDFELRALHIFVGQHDDGNVMPGFNLRQCLALFIQHEIRDFRRCLNNNLA